MDPQAGRLTQALMAALGACLATSVASAAPVLDQEQLVYNGGTSARTLPGYSTWQSFTAGLSGTLVQVDMGFFNDMSGTALLELREGAGSSGAVLQSLVVPVVGVTMPGVTWNSWAVDVQVTAGSSYTFHITPDAATLPDPYGVCIGAIDPYPGGRMGIDDPSGSYPTDFDVVFRTFVDDAAADEIDIYRSASPQGLVAPPNVLATVTASPHDDLVPPPAPLLCYAAGDEPGAPPLIFLSRAGAGGVRITWP